jgi:hypothetical protein
MPVTSGPMTWTCDNFATCGTPAVQAPGLPPGWSQCQIQTAGTNLNLVLCQVDTPAVAQALPSFAPLSTAVAAGKAQIAAAAQVQGG